MTTPGDAADAADPWARFLAALETGCDVCGGTGATPRAQWQMWYRQADELVRVAQAARRATELNPAMPAGRRASGGPADPASADPVPADPADPAAEPAIVAAIDRAIDDHMRARPSEPHEESCAACDGCGTMLTAAGRRLADLLTRHGFVRER